MITMLTDDGEFASSEAEASGEALWLPAGETAAATGWVLGAGGLCRGDVCVPLPPGREREFLAGSRVNVAALWRHLERPVIHSSGGDAWVLGASARDRAAALRSLEAPDVTLPDSAGRLHSLSEQRGRKVLLVTWASW